MIRRAALCATSLLVALAGRGWCADQPAGEPPRLETDVAPIFAKHCQRCHGDQKSEGGLNLSSARTIARGGQSGPAVVPGNVEESLLVEMISDRLMPPEDEGPLSGEQIELLRRWVATGAAAAESLEPVAARPAIAPQAREHWAFRPLTRPSVPNANASGTTLTEVDAFVVRRLAEHGLTISPQADPRTLLRRLCYDLLGLPPTPEQIEEFLADKRPDAYERLVDRLLASPHFGERWGRHWLDAAGYSDITGGDNDAGIIKLSEGKWKYRDYVVRSFNLDTPYEQFLTEQLAGDELVDWRNAAIFSPRTKELLVATGYLRSAADDTDEKELTTPDILNGVLQRTSEVVTGSLLGLTLGCAKCHDHKYEPIPQHDYYSLLAAFTPVYNPDHWLPPKQRALADIAPVQKTQAEKHNAEIDRQKGELEGKKAAIRGGRRDKIFESKLAVLPEAIRADVKTAIQTAADKRNEVQKYLADKFAGSLKVNDAEIDAALDDGEKSQLARIAQQIAELESTRRTWGTIQAAYDVAAPPDTHLLRRGNYKTPGPVVQAGFLNVLCLQAAGPGDALTADAHRTHEPVGATSGRRLALARWVTDWNAPSGGLAARVYVNRVWQHLFGRGIVETTENLGVSGAAPTHPDLLEWLACQFVAGGRRTKPLIKLLVTSAVYRQASVTADDGAHAAGVAADPGNEMLWHMPLKRLEAEIVRDAILAASGRLNPALGGPALPLETRADGSVAIQGKQLASPDAKWRRSLYVLARRNYHLSILNVFDQPAMGMNCPRRQASAVVSQSLAMLNDDFVLQQAGYFADRVRQTAKPSKASQVAMAFCIALGRPPSKSEAAWSLELLDEHADEYAKGKLPADEAAHKALVHLCHMLLNTNEFLYVP